MKSQNHIFVIALVALISAATSFAQTTTTPTPPSGTPAGSSSTGTTNSGGVAPATGRPTDTPTGPTAGGTGSGTAPVRPATPVISVSGGTPAGSATTGTTNSGGVAPATGQPTTTPTGPTAGGTGSGATPPAATTENRPVMTTGGGSSNAPTNPGKGSPHTVNENASDNAKAVQTMLRQFDAKRDKLAADRKVLIERLNATKDDADRKNILEQLRTEQQTQADERRALGKEMREELRNVRNQRKTGGG